MSTPDDSSMPEPTPASAVPPPPTQPPMQRPEQPKKKGGRFKIALIAVGVVIVLGIIGAALSGGDDAGNDETPGQLRSHLTHLC